ncbi:MAG: CsbD family protein [Sedimentitalea sp.]|uniref:CsbD family protein n=1 Tax=Sedimentitalea sp. TaxID=2048915 RepID=UPI003265B6B5
MRSARAVTKKRLIDNVGVWPDVVITLKGKAMNWDQVEGKWKEMSGSIKAKWGDLTDDELAEMDGNREALEGKLQAKYGKSKEEAQREVDDFLTEHS